MNWGLAVNVYTKTKVNIFRVVGALCVAPFKVGRVLLEIPLTVTPQGQGPCNVMGCYHMSVLYIM